MPVRYSEDGSLRGRALRRFCEPILLAESFSFAYKHNSPSRIIKTEPQRQKTLTAKDRYMKLVYKFAHVCSFEKGGATVTSTAIFKSSQGVVYALASNFAGEEKNKMMAANLETLLKMVGSTNTRQDIRNQKQNVLRHILLFNKPRIDIYLQMTVDCLQACQEQNIKNPAIIRALRGLESSIGQPYAEHNSDDDYIDSCNRCLDQIRHNKKVFAYLASLTESHVINTGNALSTNSWAELQHLVSRLYSYEEAMNCFFDAWKEWPELFQKFQIIVLRSSKPKSRRFGDKSLTAKAIVGRMSGQEDKIDEFHGIAEQLQMFNIDDRIRETSWSFKLVVHSEITLYDWVTHSDEAEGLRFFNGWRFIGASKPTCRLCKYYIDSANRAEKEHRGLEPIEVRPSHLNLYPNWSFPKAHGSSTSATARVWQATFDRMINLTRNDAFKILEERSCRGKRHDSNTYEAWSTRASQVTGDEVSVARLSERFGQVLQLRTARPENESDDDEDGGAIL